jgi:hypothetical protein
MCLLIGCGGVSSGEALEDDVHVFRLSPVDAVKADAPARMTVLHNATEFKAFFGVSAPASLDLRSHWVVHFSAGRKKTSGHVAAVERVELTDGRLTVHTRVTSPGSGCAPVSTPSNPQMTVSFARPAGVQLAVEAHHTSSVACAPAACGADLHAQLASAVDGLLFMSESDRPFEVYEAAGEGKTALTPARLLTLLGKPSDTPVVVRSIHDELAWATRDDPSMTPEEKATAERYRKLEALLESSLTDAQVYRVGTIEVHLYLVGRTRCGDLSGVTTVAIET